MIVGNIKSPQDLKSKKTIQQQLLELEVANEAEQERRVRDFKNPNRPIPVAPEYKTNAELQKDRLGQEKQAIANMEELGFDYTKSAELIAWLSSSLINRLVEFNANFKGIKKELTETTNPKLLNNEYLKQYLEKYFEDIDVNFGRKFSKDSSSSSATPSPATLGELDEILPEKGSLKETEQNAITILRDLSRGGQELKVELKRLIEENDARTFAPNVIRQMGERERRDYAREREAYARRINDSQRDLKDYSELIPKLRTVVALLKLYAVVVPSHDMLNTLKQSLTQQERADLIRRYINILRQSHFLSRGGSEELLGEIYEISQRAGYDGVANYKDDISRWVNKSLKALAFVSNESGISKITKLQRDFEVVLNQSGKIGEYDKIKQYNDIMEQELIDGQKAVRKIMEEPAVELGSFFIERDSNYIRRDNPETRKMRDSERHLEANQELEAQIADLEEDGRALRTALRDGKGVISKDDADELSEEIIRIEDQIKRLRGAKEDYLTTSKSQNMESVTLQEARESKREREMMGMEDKRDSEMRDRDRMMGVVEAVRERNEALMKKREQGLTPSLPTREPLTPAEKGVRDIEKQKETMRLLQRNFKKEIKELYADRPEIAIRSLRHFLNDNSGGEYNEKKTQRKKRDDDEWFRDLLFMLEKLSKRKVDVMEKTPNFAEYDAVAGMDRAQIYNNRNNIIGETRYGIGLKTRLAKHFREDEKEIREMAKELKRHKKAEKEAEKSSSSTDDEGKGGCGLGFRHKKISVKKVGRGISAQDSPTYLSFGKYVIHMGHLLDRNVANFKYPSLGSIPSIKPLTISDDYKEFILDTLENQKPNERIFAKLPQEEQRHFERVVSGAGLIDTFKLKRNRTEQEKKDGERFDLLRGEVMAGNNSENLLKELRGLIVRFINEGRIHQREGTNMLMEISAL